MVYLHNEAVNEAVNEAAHREVRQFHVAALFRFNVAGGSCVWEVDRAAARRFRLLAVRSSSLPHSIWPCRKAISMGVQLFFATARGLACASSSRSTT